MQRLTNRAKAVDYLETRVEEWRYFLSRFNRWNRGKLSDEQLVCEMHQLSDELKALARKLEKRKGGTLREVFADLWELDSQEA